MTKSNQMLRGLWLSLPFVALSAVAILAVSAGGAPTVTPGKISTQNMSDFEAYPSGVNNLAAPAVPPLIMLVMSKDEQLFNKAYPDYTDLNNDGVVDTTYQNAFDYNGYFDPALCYSYSSSVFAASATATNHQCASGKWSGNFLNWVSMSRLDIIRWVLYGGTRSTDTAGSTVLERAEIPDDLHAWAKVYSGSDINKYAPVTGTTTFCNVSSGTTGSWSSATTTQSGIGSTPEIRAASGDWSDWATTAKLQCQWKGAGEGDSNRPSNSGGNTAYTARVKVCQNSSTLPNEAYCVATGTSLKPEGLLQKYSTKDPANQKRFGLVTGSWTAPRKGGELRRNIGQLNFNAPGSACATGDEFSSEDGTFCYKSASSSTEGIVLTLDRLQIIGWTGSDYRTSGAIRCDAPGDGTAWGARGYDIQANPTKCPDFGNPLAGMYAEALRYIQGASGPTYTDNGVLPNPAWADPYGTVGGKPRNAPCASCSIVLISSGLNSFDDANTPSVTGLNAATLTNTVQTKEGITGSYLLSTYYNNNNLPGAPLNGTLTAAATKFSDMALCTPAAIGSLSTLTGVCLGTPGQEGSYLIAGLSYGAWSTPIRTANVSSDFKVKTFGISLSDNLPSFSIPVGSASISLSPTCRADPASKGTFASCYVGSVSLGARINQSGTATYGLVPTATYPNVGSYYLVWEDSQYGSDHDQDATNVISWCVGASCSAPSSVVSGGVAICDPLVVGATKSSSTQGNACNASNGKLTSPIGATDVIVRNQWIGYSSGAMNLGYQLSGTTADAVTEVDNSGVTFGCNMLANIICNSKPQANKFTLRSGAAVTTLQSPLWYAAKYSGFTGAAPVLAPGQDPENYFFARNAGELKDQLDSVFRSITSTAANNFGNATTPSSSNDVKGNGLSYQVQYFQQRLGVSWTGSLQAFWSDSEGYQREGKIVAGKQVLDSSSNYVMTGPDTTTGALAGALAPYRCTVKPASTGSTPFDPSTNAGCSIVSATNPLQPAWDAGTLLNAFYDPIAAAGSADAQAIANLATQRAYSADASATANIGQRYIFTYLTAIPNGSTATGTVANGTQTDFVWNDGSCDSNGWYTLGAASGFCGGISKSNSNARTGNYGLLNEKDPALAKKLVNWVRGVEYPVDYRSRTNNLTTGRSTYRLGDIVDSSPMIVDTPAESYDLLYSDYSYASFRANYRNRRQMVYVGANDGMLHAFNGGFYVTGQAAGADPAANPATTPTAYRQLPTGMNSGDATVPQGNNWALGQEAWAFVPDNLLPHLRWLADKDYTHVFYVDGSPVVTDAQVFTSTDITGASAACKAGTAATADIDAKGHICGWGTIMVVPFRLGGGAIKVDTVGLGATGDGQDHGNCNHHGNNCDYDDFQSSNSAYVVLDVTDPEQPPTVLGEITTGTYTTSAPAFAVHREADGKLHFLLTIGSGPADNGGPGGKTVSAPASSKLSVSVYDLATLVGKSVVPAKTLATTGPANSFAGDMVASDFDLNYSAEGVYFGAVTNPAAVTGPSKPAAYSGSLWKVDMNTGATTAPDKSDPSTWTLKEVIDNGQPITIRPSVALDSASRPIIYFGTGRSFTTDDDSGVSNQGLQQQYIYGVTDNSLLLGLPAACQAMPTTTSLFNASAVTVSDKGAVGGLPTSGFAGVSTLSNLQSALLSTVATGTNAGCYTYSGWRMSLKAGDSSSGTQLPSERVVSSQTLLGGILLTPTYVPPSKTAIDASGSSDCNPIPVPGTSNLYGLNYITGTADTSLLGSFGAVSGTISKVLLLGSGKASAPVLHSQGGTVTAAFGLSGGTKLQAISTLNGTQNGEISWREPVDNQ